MSTSGMLLPDWLRRSAANHPNRLALRCGPVTWSFAELDRQATRFARKLATAGAREGVRVALLAQNGVDYVVAVHALTRLGAVLVPLNTRLTLDEHCWQLADVRASLLLCDAVYAARAAEIGQRMRELPLVTLASESSEGMQTLSVLSEDERPLRDERDEIDLSATQAILYTSGTTGQPKGAIITYGMQWWNAAASALNLGHDPQDRWLACLPLYHIGGLSILFRSVIYGIGVVVLERFDAAAVNEAIAAERVTIISVVTVMLQRMLAALDEAGVGKRYPAALRCVLLGGGPAPRPLLEDCAQRHIPVVQTYGLTESCSQAATLAPDDALRKLGSAGKPLTPVQLRIVHEGESAAPGNVGEIELRGPTITPGYADRPDATAAAFRDGWLATGDIGYLDADGYLYVLDRRVDLIISGGENVYPAEIEATLLAHPDVEEVGVCGMPDAQWGQAPVAFVRLRGGRQITPDDLLIYAAERLARYKVPRGIYIVAVLPRTSSGKLLRRELPSLLPDA
ncbi:MAG TPA: o-succinylbenzoate--CoA ligase [Ktedonobacterales bacterium]